MGRSTALYFLSSKQKDCRCWVFFYHSLYSNYYRRCRTAACIIFNLSHHDHISPCLIQLHWLPVWVHVQYKLCTLVHSVHNNRCPMYISDVVSSIKMVSTCGGLHMAESIDCILPRLRTKFAEHCFVSVGPALWNSLPKSISRTSSQAALFSEALNTVYKPSWLLLMYWCCNAPMVFLGNGAL